MLNCENTSESPACHTTCSRSALWVVYAPCFNQEENSMNTFWTVLTVHRAFVSRLHPGGEGGDRSPPPDPKPAGAARINSSTAANTTGHHTGYNQQVNKNMSTTFPQMNPLTFDISSSSWQSHSCDSLHPTSSLVYPTYCVIWKLHNLANLHAHLYT